MTDTNSTSDLERISGYEFTDAERNCSHDYLKPAVESILSRYKISPQAVFDLGCGTGSFAFWLSKKGFSVKGADPSKQGIELAKKSFPELDLRIGSAYEPLWNQFGTFPLVTSLEVVEHVYSPREFASCVWKMLDAGGFALISTPYHGYLKNLALAITGKLDSHFTALWDHGHIKFWSPKTISFLFKEQGFEVQDIVRVGRVPLFAKSMIAVLRKPTK